MHIVTVDGPAAAAVHERLAEELSGRGSVVTIDRTGGRIEGGEPVVRIDEDGTWSARGDDGSFGEWLDALAPRYAYAILLTSEDTSWPRIVAGSDRVRGDLVSSPTPREELDIPSMVDALEATEPYVTLGSLVQEVKGSTAADRAGAIATFTGRVRAKDDPADDPTEYLEFETYADVAAKKMRTIEEELRNRDGVHEVRLHHRTGVIPAGEDIVFVVVLAGHREEAFRTVEDGINRLKAEVPIFKKEVTVGDEFWVHTRP